MRGSLCCVVALLAGGVFGSVAMADEMHDNMEKACAPLFAPGGACADLAKGTRNCVREHLAKGGAECEAFEKANTAFFDAGKDDPTVKK